MLPVTYPLHALWRIRQFTDQHFHLSQSPALTCTMSSPCSMISISPPPFLSRMYTSRFCFSLVPRWLLYCSHCFVLASVFMSHHPIFPLFNVMVKKINSLWCLTIASLVMSFKPFGSVRVEWPGKADGRHLHHPPKGRFSVLWCSQFYLIYCPLFNVWQWSQSQVNPTSTFFGRWKYRGTHGRALLYHQQTLSCGSIYCKCWFLLNALWIYSSCVSAPFYSLWVLAFLNLVHQYSGLEDQLFKKPPMV